MKKISIIKSGQITNGVQFETQSEVDAWLAKHIAKNTFGLPERPELVLDEATGEMIPTGNTLPAEYEIVIEDITTQIEQEKINAEAKQFLNDTDKFVIRHRDQKELNIPTKLSEEEYQALLLARQEARNRVV